MKRLKELRVSELKARLQLLSKLNFTALLRVKTPICSDSKVVMMNTQLNQEEAAEEAVVAVEVVAVEAEAVPQLEKAKELVEVNK